MPVCVDKLEAPRDTEALALEKPRKKLSFMEPEITTNGYRCKSVSNGMRNGHNGRTNSIKWRPVSEICDKNGALHRNESFDDCDLEVGKINLLVVNVCHK